MMSHAALLPAPYCWGGGDETRCWGMVEVWGKHITRQHAADNGREQATALV